MENASKNITRSCNRLNTHNTPMKSVSFRIKNQFIRANCGVAPVRKARDCLNPTSSRGDTDTWNNYLQRKNEVRENPSINSERGSIMSMSTMTTTNYGKQLNIMVTRDPINGIKFIVRELKQRLKSIYPDDEVFYQMISEIGHLAKRVEHGDSLPVTEGETKPKSYMENCTECESVKFVVRQMDEDLVSVKDQNKILSAQTVDLESQIVVKQSEIAQVEQELSQVKEQLKNLQAVVAEKKSYDDSLLNKLDEHKKKLQEVAEELFMSKLENERILNQLTMKMQCNDRINEINSDIMESTESRMKVKESMLDVAKKSSTDLSYKADGSGLKLLVFENDERKLERSVEDDKTFTSIITINVTDV